MNLFLLRIGSDSGDEGDVSPEDRAGVPSHLDLERNESRSIHLTTPDGRRISLHVWLEEKSCRGPREYLFEGADEVVFYTGLVFHEGTGRCYLDAEEIGNRWAQLTDQMGGRFVVIRLDKRTGEVELLTDPVGVLNIYICRGAGEILVSNRLEVIRANARLSVDTEGLSSYLACGWYLADKTPFAGVSVLPGGTACRFGGDAPMSTHRYFDRYEIIGEGHRSLRDVSGELIQSITPILCGLSDVEGELYCALTGGSDSRVLLSLLQHARVEPRYFTRYSIDSDDVEIPRRLAADLGLDYRDEHIEVDPVIDDWNSFARWATRRTDGAVNLWQFPDFLSGLFAGPHRSILIEAVDGAVQTNWHIGLVNLLGLRGEEGLRSMVNRNTLDVLAPEVLAHPRAWVREYLDTSRQHGVGLGDAWAACYAFEELHRWGAAQATKWDAWCDYPMLFLSRPFLRAGFSTAPRHRYAMALHFQIARDISPALAAAPSSRDSWGRPTLASQIWLRVEHRWRARARRIRTGRRDQPDPFRRDQVFPRLTDPIREMIGDHPGSPVWDLVDRDKLVLEIERFQRHGGPLRRIEQLLTVLTPLYYLSE